MEYEICQHDEHLRVKVAGRLDAQTAPTLESAMREKLDGIIDITFDLSELVYISSAGLRILLASYELVSKREGTMQVEHVTGDVLYVMQMSGLATLFGIESE